jgi:hypothetical protein
MSAPQANLQHEQQRGYRRHKRDEFCCLDFAHGLCLLEHGRSVPFALRRGQYADAAEGSIRRMP